MDERIIRELSDFNVLPARTVPQTLYNRSGSHVWTLWHEKGEQKTESQAAFAKRTSSHFGTEGTSGPDKVGTSRCDFSEGLEYVRIDNLIGRPRPDGTVQKFTGGLYIMLSGIQLWSGEIKVHEKWEDTTVNAEYSIKQSISRQITKSSKFDLLILPPIPAFKDQDVGHALLHILKDPGGDLLEEKDLSPGSGDDPWLFNLRTIPEISSRVTGEHEYLKVEVTAEIHLHNEHSKVAPVVGGSYCGLGFADYV